MPTSIAHIAAELGVSPLDVAEDLKDHQHPAFTDSIIDSVAILYVLNRKRGTRRHLLLLAEYQGELDALGVERDQGFKDEFERIFNERKSANRSYAQKQLVGVVGSAWAAGQQPNTGRAREEMAKDLATKEAWEGVKEWLEQFDEKRRLPPISKSGLTT